MVRALAASRRQARERALSLLYEAETKGVTPAEVVADLPVEPAPFASELVLGFGEHQAEVDGWIVRFARDWALERMPALDRALLRLGVYELAYRPDVPTGAVISEAVELAQRYSTDDSSRFVNGVLAAIANEVRPGSKAAPVVIGPAPELPEPVPFDEEPDAVVTDRLDGGWREGIVRGCARRPVNGVLARVVLALLIVVLSVAAWSRLLGIGGDDRGGGGSAAADHPDGQAPDGAVVTEADNNGEVTVPLNQPFVVNLKGSPAPRGACPHAEAESLALVTSSEELDGSVTATFVPQEVAPAWWCGPSAAARPPRPSPSPFGSWGKVRSAR